MPTAILQTLHTIQVSLLIGSKDTGLPSLGEIPLVLLCDAAVAMMSCSDALVSSGGGGGVSSVRGGMAEW